MTAWLTLCLVRLFHSETFWCLWREFPKFFSHCFKLVTCLLNLLIWALPLLIPMQVERLWLRHTTMRCFLHHTNPHLRQERLHSRMTIQQYHRQQIYQLYNSQIKQTNLVTWNLGISLLYMSSYNNSNYETYNLKAAYIENLPRYM